MRQFLIILTAFVCLPILSHAEDTVPARTQQLRSGLSPVEWQSVEPGLELLEYFDAAVSLTAFRIDPRLFRFKIAVQKGADGDSVANLAEAGKAVLAVNGGFFGEKSPGKDFFPVGLLRVNGKSLSTAWDSKGGFLVIRPDGLQIVPSASGLPDDADNAVQSRPVLIEPGGKWAMNTNLEYLRPRTIVCLRPHDREIIIAVLGGFGMSLYESGWLMRGKNEGGHFGCDSAIAMDGGGSTQLWVAARRDLAMPGDGNVHNALLVLRR